MQLLAFFANDWGACSYVWANWFSSDLKRCICWLELLIIAYCFFLLPTIASRRLVLLTFFCWLVLLAIVNRSFYRQVLLACYRLPFFLSTDITLLLLTFSVCRLVFLATAYHFFWLNNITCYRFSIPVDWCYLIFLRTMTLIVLFCSK